MRKKKQKPKPNYRKFDVKSCFNNEMSADEKKLKDELAEYRENHKKPWYLR